MLKNILVAEDNRHISEITAFHNFRPFVFGSWPVRKHCDAEGNPINVWVRKYGDKITSYTVSPLNDSETTPSYLKNRQLYIPNGLIIRKVCSYIASEIAYRHTMKIPKEEMARFLFSSWREMIFKMGLWDDEATRPPGTLFDEVKENLFALSRTTIFSNNVYQGKTRIDTNLTILSGIAANKDGEEDSTVGFVVSQDFLNLQIGNGIIFNGKMSKFLNRKDVYLWDLFLFVSYIQYGLVNKSQGGCAVVPILKLKNALGFLDTTENKEVNRIVKKTVANLSKCTHLFFKGKATNLNNMFSVKEISESDLELAAMGEEEFNEYFANNILHIEKGKLVIHYARCFLGRDEDIIKSIMDSM